jgi:hypothetical protein
MKSLFLAGAFLLAVPFGCSTPGTLVPVTTGESQSSTVPTHLQAFVGAWTTVSEFQTEPGGPLQRSAGTAIGRSVGERWVLVEHSGTHFGTPFTGILVVGYDPQSRGYSGIWLDSLSSNLARYQGTVGPSGTLLTLHTQVPSAERPGTTDEIREEIEIRSPDYIVLTTKAKSNSEWTTLVTVHYRRQK